MHASIFVITLSLPYHLIFLFSFEFFSLFSLGVFYLPLVTPSSFRSSPVHGYLYPFYTFLNLWDFSLLSLRLYQLLLASFQDYPLVCWLPNHYLCSEGACHTTPHFQTKILVLFLSRSLPCLPSMDKGLSVLRRNVTLAKHFPKRSLSRNPRIDLFSPYHQTTPFESLD